MQPTSVPQSSPASFAPAAVRAPFVPTVSTQVNPSLDLAITEPQRDRAVDYLQQAYADGRLTAEEFDARMGQALGAHRRRELNAAFAGLVQIPLTSTAVGLHPAYRPMFNQHHDGATGRALGVIAHWSSFVFSFVGPALAYALAQRGTYAAREAAKAFNFQLTALVGLIGLAVLTSPIDAISETVIPLYVLFWFVSTLLGGVNAAHGNDWSNPLMKLVPFRVLDEGRPQGKRGKALGR